VTFGKILIANRGEIACRVIRTARRMGIRSVAVYSEADSGAWHVAMADEAVAIGPAPARESYLAGDKIIAAARATGAEAIHPGYGFLSENADFAEACAAAGLVFIGPPPAAIRAMGSKSEAKALMEKAKVPVVPGYHGADQVDTTLAAAAARIGYPVLLKASAGGGGKGMRRVDDPADFAAALASARREASAAFGDQRMLVEKYLLGPRHVELQVFADSHGKVLHLFERDCSIQRRHQKVIEEARAPGLGLELRERMAAAAVAAAGAIGYVGAGTIELILDRAGHFFFMEMNTRLQVEHPVTEMITGFDLVEWQLRVAAGERLPLDQAEVTARGHALEARIYAEDAARDFLPSTGRLLHFVLPTEDRHLRIDSGVRPGDEIGVHYDPMLAKLIVWDEDRELARLRLVDALGRVEIVGLANNVAFLRAIAADPGFAAGEIDTGFIERNWASLSAPPTPAPEPMLAAAVGALWLGQMRKAEGTAASSGDPHSPWHAADGWRLNLEASQSFRFLDAGKEMLARLRHGRNGLELDIGAGSSPVAFQDAAGDRLRVTLNGRRFDATVVRRGQSLTIFLDGMTLSLELADPLAAAEAIETPSGRLTAPMPGRIVQLDVVAGAKVKRGDRLLVLEAMKMEHSILAPADGIVESLDFAVGDLVEEGVALLSLLIEDVP
jgi:3-methylcrotonyl-CoA carboxylase alpha subunit